MISPRFLVLCLLTLFISGGEAFAAPTPAPAAETCVEPKQEASRLRRSLEECTAETQRSADGAARAEAERDRASRQNADLTASLRACVDARERSCSATGAFADAVAAAAKITSVPVVPSCVSPAQHSAVEQVVESYATSSSLISEFVAYASGATDLPPQPRSSSKTPLRALVDRLAGAGKGPPPLLLRRLLVEALERVSPRFWRRIKAGGRGAVDAWFSSGAPLDEALVAEAQAGALIEGGPTGSTETPTLVSALRLVQSYRELVCDRQGSEPRDCTRARQLQSLLETSGPLIVRQRIHEIWATPCAQIAKRTILDWLRDFPSARSALGRADWRDISGAARGKLFACYLADDQALGPRASAGLLSFSAWLADRLPSPDALTGRTLAHIDDIRTGPPKLQLEEACVRAVDALERLENVSSCELPGRDQRILADWFTVHGPAERGLGSFEVQLCAQMADVLWRGRQPHVATSINHVPRADEVMSTVASAAGGAAALRAACDKRSGPSDSFVDRFRAVVGLAQATGEDVTKQPWRADPLTHGPREAERVRAALTFRGWLGHMSNRASPCGALELEDTRCQVCRGPARENSYDCLLLEQVRSRWGLWSRLSFSLVTGLAAILGLLVWVTALGRALRAFGAWNSRVRADLAGVDIRIRRDWWRWFFPWRFQALTMVLPADPAWRRWGRRASVVAVEAPRQILERDVSRAAARARMDGAELALLLHEEGASPDLKAVRALLEWAAKGPGRALHILPLATERLKGARTADDLLDIIEEISLRGNPFDLRGRLVSSSQFFDRERLVSGLLAAAQAGQWTMLTGLRRFGKSSLALETTRRLPGPSAYVDLAGFHREVGSGEGPGETVDLLLRYALTQLHQSARERYGTTVTLPEPPQANVSMDASALLLWLRLFATSCRTAEGERTPSFLLVFDELEQAIGVGPTRVTHAVEVLSILLGRLRATLLGTLVPAGCRFGVVFCSAVHPVLWAPLTTLGQQSLMNACQTVFVPRLPAEAATMMMRGLGARQGIRFTDAAVALIVRETAGIPILARRAGSSVLELYDPERARQGTLGAVEIGVEGAAAAVRREEEPEAPLRVWVEAEIGDVQNPAGVILRKVARAGQVGFGELRALAFDVTRSRLITSGIDRMVSPSDLDRLAREAAGFVLRMLVEVGILDATGDVSAPESLSFPDSIVKRILAAAPGDAAPAQQDAPG